ncbi:MAG: hypothetical protein Q7S79_02500 [bacterium]|nr:hypothetical protein [bacterium]
MQPERLIKLKLRGLKPSESSSSAPSERKSAEAFSEITYLLLRRISSLHPRFENLGFREGGLNEIAIIQMQSLLHNPAIKELTI